jgi:hypothetical protein
VITFAIIFGVLVDHSVTVVVQAVADLAVGSALARSVTRRLPLTLRVEQARIVCLARHKQQRAHTTEAFES